jgi:hypothetical protein
MATAIGTNKLELTLGGVAVGRDCTSAVVESGDSPADTLTFYQASLGGAREYKLVATFVQTSGPVVTGAGGDPTGKPFDLIWSHAGETCAVVVKPGGNSVATAALPHYSGTVTITEPNGPMVGTSADASTSAMATFDVEWIFTAKPAIITA